MPWAVRYEWPSGTQFYFNCYCHWATLVVRNAGGSGHLFHSKERMTQGYPISMVFYSVGILLLICEVHPQFIQPWYANNVSTRGHFVALRAHLEDLMVCAICRATS